MAEVDASGAPSESVFVSVERKEDGTFGSAAEWLRSRLRRIQSETILQATIPALVVIFLLIMAAIRFLSLQEESALRVSLAETELLLAVQTYDNAIRDGKPVAVAIDRAMRGSSQRASGLIVVPVDRNNRVTDTANAPEPFRGRSIDELTGGSGALLGTFEGEKVVTFEIAGAPFWGLIRVAGSRGQSVLAMIPQGGYQADLRRSISLNVTLFAFTSLILLMLLYAYFSQIAKARIKQMAARDAHERVDMALSRGRCGLWDWDLSTGSMFWSRSMHTLLGYDWKQRVFSLSQISAITHPDDDTLLSIARRFAARETTELDTVVRMRHSAGHWVHLRLKAQTVDPVGSFDRERWADTLRRAQEWFPDLSAISF